MLSTLNQTKRRIIRLEEALQRHETGGEGDSRGSTPPRLEEIDEMEMGGGAAGGAAAGGAVAGSSSGAGTSASGEGSKAQPVAGGAGAGGGAGGGIEEIDLEEALAGML